jgi:Flp pilus assembly protein TadB
VSVALKWPRDSVFSFVMAGAFVFVSVAWVYARPDVWTVPLVGGLGWLLLGLRERRAEKEARKP